MKSHYSIFENFWFWDVQIKPSKSFLLKKIPQKKIFQCKFIGRWSLLQVNNIALITRWQVLSFWSNLYINKSRKKSQRIALSFYYAIHAARLVQMPLKTKKRPCPFLSATARRKKLALAENLAESNKGLLLCPGAMKLNEQPNAECDQSVSHSHI